MCPEIETPVREEWLPHAGVIFTAIEAAYGETERIMADNPLLLYRNRAQLRGQLRYFLSAAVLHQCVAQNRLPGIEAQWLTQGCDILVLNSKSFEVQLAHTSSTDQKPKASQRREFATVSNQLLLDGILQGKPPSPDALVQLFLLHGDKSLSFVNLACPDSLDRDAGYVYLSPNFATCPRVVPSADVEDIQEVVPLVAEEIIERIRSAGNE